MNVIEVAADNPIYHMLQNNHILVETATGKVIQCLPGSTITADMGEQIKSFGAYCCSRVSNVTQVEVPAGITTIAGNAFSYCDDLEEVVLPDTLIQLGATCFYSCPKLSKVNLPKNLIEINTYVFAQSALSTVEIPNTVTTIRDNAFGDIKTLRTVTFKKRVNDDGSIYIPDVYKAAFNGAGSVSNPVVFNVPWSEAQHNSFFNTNGRQPSFGAAYYTFNFDYKEAE
jgi:hypothetical protein